MTSVRPSVEEIVRQVVNEQLNLAIHGPEIGFDDSLRDLGMTSLTCLGLMLNIEDVFGIELPEALLKESTFSSISSIVAAVDDVRHPGSESLTGAGPRATAPVRALLGGEVQLGHTMEDRTPPPYAPAILRERLLELDAATREHRLEKRMWGSRMFTGDRRVDLFVTAGDSGEASSPVRTLVVLDGSEFVDIMRLPVILDQLVLAGRIPMTAAVFVSPVDRPARRAELLDDTFVDVLADELVPYLRAWLGDRWQMGRTTAVGASLGAITAIRAALRRPDCFDGAIALSGPLTDYRLAAPVATAAVARFFLSASREEADILLDDGFGLLDANARTAKELADQGYDVRCEYGDGGHTYAAWEAMLPQAVSWMLGAERRYDEDDPGGPSPTCSTTRGASSTS
jgi:enterochelin esterase-like enzyme/acyl carrier protein